MITGDFNTQLCVSFISVNDHGLIALLFLMDASLKELIVIRSSVNDIGLSLCKLMTTIMTVKPHFRLGFSGFT